MRRAQESLIKKDLHKKLVFLVGPRQVGKTWLAKEIGQTAYTHTVYLNYDRHQDRKMIENESWVPSTTLLILDELHKMPKWKRYLKGVYDTKPDTLHLLVTGSARLDTFRQSGESLAGRFFLHRLLPFSLSELQHTHYEGNWERLLSRGGFPEPFLAENENDAERWRATYIDGLLREDVLDFEKILDLRAMKLVLDLLRHRIGSPISYQSIAEDVHIAPNTVKKYVAILEALYIVFRVPPFSKKIARSLLKEPKIYFFDSGLVPDIGARFENLVATCLLKHAYSQEDKTGVPHDLYYLRTKDKLEVDFCLTKHGQITGMYEAKLSDDTLHPALQNFHAKYGFSGKQIVGHLKRERVQNNIEIVSAARFLGTLA
jgi:predicted AAA+ superfamily ATPase